MDVRVINELVHKQSAFIDKLNAEMGKVIVGQKAMIERIMIGLLTGGHVLLEGVPGLAKTLTVKGAKSTWTFNASSAQAWEGSKSIGVDELSSHTGAKVTVKYTDHDGQMSASSVRITPAHVAKASSKSK